MKSSVYVFLVIGAVIGNELKEIDEYHDVNLRFASDVYTEFLKKHDGNFLICPVSAHTVLSLATMGAKEKTAQELTAALHMPNSVTEIKKMYLHAVTPNMFANDTYQLTNANKVYVNKNIQIKPDFATIAYDVFQAQVQNLNFADKKEATKEINDWVEFTTHYKIKNLMGEDSIKPNTGAVLVNTIYFKGDWVYPFGAPFSMPFYVTKTQTVDVPMMIERNDFNYYENKELNAEFLEMPFVGGDVVMTIALPKQKDGLSILEKSISKVLAKQPYQMLDTMVTIPKFTMETKIDFKSILQSFGASLPFSSAADFSGISDSPLAIDEIVQKTFIEVTEIGATAGAATEITAMVVSMPRADFHADHPFIYYLRHKMLGVFFVGRYTKP